MEFIKMYHEKIGQFRTKYFQIVAENEQNQKKLADFDSKYKAHVTSLDFDKANSVKLEMKNLEAVIETKEDLLKVLKDKVSKGDPDAAMQAAKQYKAEKEKQMKKADYLIKQAEKKKAELIESLKEIDQYNSVLTIGSRELAQLQKVMQWRTPEVIKEVGFDLTIASNSGSGTIQIFDYMVKDIMQIRN